MPNPSSTALDPLLGAIKHYQSYPAMLPFVGGDYRCEKHRKLLFVGESFYFPPTSTLHTDCESWYRGSQSSLSAEEVEYIHCRRLVEGDWRGKGHQMYKELNRCLDSFELRYNDRAISHVAYMNAFLRPAAEPGKSFEWCCTDMDIAVSLDTIKRVVAAIKPDLVVFASMYAWDAVGRRLSENLPAVKFDFVSHPTDPFHWNVKRYPHGRKKLMGILAGDFILAAGK